ncbi:MAG: hypothetical protein EXR69_08745 [Myxococcales bacterium]|nr:hypothetical protein [Myxococcales bacterium]
MPVAARIGVGGGLWALGCLMASGCSGTSPGAGVGAEPPGGPMQNAPLQPPPGLVPAVPPGPATLREFSMNTPGGLHGAPEGLNFVIPDAALAQASAGPLSDASVGFTLTATAPSDAVVCTQPKAMAPSIGVSARLKVKAVQPGPQPFTGMSVELRARDDAGNLVSAAEGRYTVVKNIREAGDFTTVQATVPLPAGATRGEVCFRFPGATGVVEVDSLAIDGLRAEPTPMSGTSAVPTLPPPTKRFDLDEPGGGSGAPAGADFFIAKGTAGVTTHVGEIDGTHAAGFSLDVSQPGDALVCSHAFDVVGGATVWPQGGLRVRSVTADTRAFTGLSAEVRAYDQENVLVSPAEGAFVPLQVWKFPTPGPSGTPELGRFGKEITVPTGAVTAKICLRFAEATGGVDVDWLGVTQSSNAGASTPAQGGPRHPGPSASP